MWASAAEAGITVQELLRRAATKLASRPSMKEWLERVGRGPASDITRDVINKALDELRGPWPDAGQ